MTRDVEAALAAMQPGLSGLEIDTTIFRPATFIEKAIDNLALALLIGAVLVVLLLGAFLFRWRTALISVVAIPLSLLAAALVLYALGTTINAIVLAGLMAALASSSTTRSSTSRTSCGGFGSTARKAVTSRRRPSSSRRRARCAAPRSTRH